MHEQTYDVAQAVQPQGQEQTAVQRGGISPTIVTGDDPYAKLFNVDIAPQQQVAMQQPIRIETGQLTPHQVIDFSSALWSKRWPANKVYSHPLLTSSNDVTIAELQTDDGITQSPPNTANVQVVRCVSVNRNRHDVAKQQFPSEYAALYPEETHPCKQG